jgi:hypothetical protein
VRRIWKRNLGLGRLEGWNMKWRGTSGDRKIPHTIIASRDEIDTTISYHS